MISQGSAPMPTAKAVLMQEAAQVGADLNAWLAAGGGIGLRNALQDPEGITAVIAAADLRGMGGAGFPTHRKWEMIAAHKDCDKFVVCNGNEDEPGTFKDRFLLEHTPHQVIEGALIAAVATRANHIVIYINPHEPRSVASVQAAVLQWQAHQLLADMAPAVGGPVSLSVCLSSGLYIGGEETAVIATVEGGFPFPRRKPPYPADRGIHDCPTVINNTETLAHVPHILANGARSLRAAHGDDARGARI
jgi:NADH-quinone oxidoreductase subunit F